MALRSGPPFQAAAGLRPYGREATRTSRGRQPALLRFPDPLLASLRPGSPAHRAAPRAASTIPRSTGRLEQGAGAPRARTRSVQRDLLGPSSGTNSDRSAPVLASRCAIEEVELSRPSEEAAELLRGTFDSRDLGGREGAQQPDVHTYAVGRQSPAPGTPHGAAYGHHVGEDAALRSGFPVVGKEGRIERKLGVEDGFPVAVGNREFIEVGQQVCRQGRLAVASRLGI